MADGGIKTIVMDAGDFTEGNLYYQYMKEGNYSLVKQSIVDGKSQVCNLKANLSYDMGNYDMFIDLKKYGRKSSMMNP